MLGSLLVIVNMAIDPMCTVSPICLSNFLVQLIHELIVMLGMLKSHKTQLGIYSMFLGTDRIVVFTTTTTHVSTLHRVFGCIIMMSNGFRVIFRQEDEMQGKLLILVLSDRY